ncbi:1-pyrroline-5-carboxylate dehydrogenase [Aeromicrobium sp. Root495]|uniref:proline dehydrogenase family protein n=1 Tax=Aeromicrobium sp. Root495 TaxID=1736550 RepID=UPI0006FD2290|nr:proline dehydrogenase family protein [Aeromicrobium sp. Root495]KQY59440.1 1-pyrroline-5-carboxylate dehydrogenase [Aeromicrobium sp. Root495]
MSQTPLADRSVDLVRSWTRSPEARRSDPAGKRLSRLLQDPAGLEFTIGFVDRVVRPEDTAVAARNLRRLASSTPRFLPWHQRLLLKLGALVSFVMPGLVVGTARRTLRRLVGHLVVDARPERLGKSIARLRKKGDRLNLNLLGEAVLGEGEALRRRDQTLAVLERDDVDYVSVKVSAVASQLSLWAFEETVERVVERLLPLYEAASRKDAFINLDMEEYRDLDLTVMVFTRILDRFPDLTAGIVLQAYLPDALGAMQRLQEWASDRRAHGGARIKVRVVKGANLAMERVDATVHHWPLATWHSKLESDAHYKRVLDWAMTPERIDAVRLGVAGQNLFDVAHAFLLAGDRQVADGVEFEMLLGMDSGPVAAARRDVGALLLYTPVVHPDEFDVAISYLVRRLEENASEENFLSAAFSLSRDPASFDREADRFRASLAAVPEEVPGRHRVQDRTQDRVSLRNEAFENTADTDPSTPANRSWGRTALSRSTYTQLGVQTIEESKIYGPASLETFLRQARRAGADWAEQSLDTRAWILHQAGAALAARRGDLVAVMAAETGKTIAEADVEVSEAIDFAHYYAESARRLAAVDGATFTPARLTVVTPPWNFPVAIPAGSVLAALAAGSAVVIKPAPQSPRCAAVMVEALWQGGVPRDVLRYASVEEGPLSKALVAHTDVDRVILTGSWETAALFRSWRPDLPLLAETSGKNAIVVTPSADLDLAVADLAKSAFGHAGQKCSAASLAILVGSVGESERFRRQLVDAVSSMRVAWPEDPEAVIGPVIQEPEGKLADALTTLAPGESWLLEPRRLDETGRLWSPGIRTGVRPGSEFHTTEYFGPVLGLMHAPSLETAVQWQNATDFGLTAGIHTLDADEAGYWAERVEAGNLYVNRGITGAVVQRQPFGGWKRSSVGTTSKAGGPNYLVHLGTWAPAPPRRHLDDVPLDARVSRLLEAAVPHLDQGALQRLGRAAASDQTAWAREFGISKDVSGLGVERNLLRYRPVPVTVRLGGELEADLRIVLAAIRSGAPVVVSTPASVPGGLLSGLTEHVHVEDEGQWLARVAAERPARIRLVGGDARAVHQAVAGDPDVAVHAGQVTWSGRIELLPFLREQAVSVTAHRFGNPDPAFRDLPL